MRSRRSVRWFGVTVALCVHESEHLMRSARAPIKVVDRVPRRPFATGAFLIEELYQAGQHQADASRRT